jgi:hypothetical protein
LAVVLSAACADVDNNAGTAMKSAAARDKVFNIVMLTFFSCQKPHPRAGHPVFGKFRFRIGHDFRARTAAG